MYVYRRGAGAGSVAAFANEFRYRLVNSRPVIWVDTDVLCLSSTWPAGESHFGWVDDEHHECNVAVLGLPVGHPILSALIEEIESLDRADVRYGQMGPQAFTRLVRDFDLDQLALAPSAFYPVHYRDQWKMFDPSERGFIDRVTSNSLAIHLWDELLTRVRWPVFLRPPSGSFVADALRRHGVSIPIAAEVHDLEPLRHALEESVPIAQYQQLEGWALEMERELTARASQSAQASRPGRSSRRR